jgi:hypothetical protein
MKSPNALFTAYLIGNCPGTFPEHNEGGHGGPSGCSGCIKTALAAVRADTLREAVDLCLKQADNLQRGKDYSDHPEECAIVLEWVAEQIEILGATVGDGKAHPKWTKSNHRTMDLE